MSWHIALWKLASASGPCIEGFGASVNPELQGQIQRLKEKLKPGDIINTDPRKPRGGDRLFKYVSKTVQGTRFGHSAIYDGKGHVIEARAHTVIRRPLEDLVRCNRVVAVSPKGVTEKDRARAVSWMNKHVGNNAFRVTLGNLAIHGARPTALSGKHERKRRKIDRALCSNLIANAYAKIPFNPDRRIADTRPVDILRSRKTKVVGKIT